MKKKTILIAAIIVCVVGLIAIYFFVYERNASINKLENEGGKLVQKVEEYKKRNHKIPQYLEDMRLNLPDDYPIYYNAQKDSISYTVSFQIAPFKSMVYYSDTKSWIAQ